MNEIRPERVMRSPIMNDVACAAHLVVAAGFKEKPAAPLGFVDPGFEQAGAGDFAMFVA